MAEGGPLLPALVFIVALLYSSVGHGGASGYLAAMTLLGAATEAARPSALVLNLLVAGLSFVGFWRAGHFRGRLLWPFALTSIPMAWLGGRTRVPPRVYAGLLAAVLVFAAWRLLLKDSPRADSTRAAPPHGTTLAVGAAIGLLSGLVGVGGGIFLSPLMILRGWAEPKAAAAASAGFIWVNSAAGLLGTMSRGGLDTLSLWPLAAAAFVGGTAGSHLGARRLPSPALRRLLALVLAIASFKLARVALEA